MPAEHVQPLSDAGKAALGMMRDARLESGDGVIARDAVILGVCALFNEPISADGRQVISSLAPVARNPKLAIESFLDGREKLAAALEGGHEEIRTSFGPFAGMRQAAAKQTLMETVEALKAEIAAKFGAQLVEVERASGSALRRGA